MRTFAVMASSPPCARKKKRTERQLTLFGGFAVCPSVLRKTQRNEPCVRSILILTWSDIVAGANPDRRSTGIVYVPFSI